MPVARLPGILYASGERTGTRSMEPRVYHLGRIYQVIYGTMGLVFIGAGIFFLYQFGFGAAIVALLISLPGLYLCRWAMRSRLTLTETEISVRYAFREKGAPLSEVEGLREGHSSKGGSYWVLQLRENSGSLSITQMFAVDDTFLDVLSKLGANRVP